jgi:hypothetical protein
VISSHGPNSTGGPGGPELSRPRRWGRRLGLSAIALVLADLVLGFIVFCLAVLGILWYFAFSWIQLSGEYSSSGLQFGSAGQLATASALVFVIPIMIGLVCYLGWNAARLPRGVWASARTGGALRSAITGASAGVVLATSFRPGWPRR